jgi:late competence protein required for DNA uptake (superfamily II DNA/RNA helicase)
MLLAKENKSVSAKDNIDERLLKYFRKKVNKINIVSLFYNTPKIFQKVISYALAQKKTVLYITNELEKNISLLEILERDGFKCNYLGDNHANVLKEKINICSHNRALYLDEKFDLVIYDDINYMPLNSKESIKNLLESCCDNFGTMISYSIEPIFHDEVNLFYPLDNNGKPLVEPRIINTRLNVNDDLPLVVFDYLSWSILSNKRVIIYVPDEEKVENIYNYLENFKDRLTKNIFAYKKDEKNKKNLVKFFSRAKGIVVTNSFSEEDVDLSGVNVMIFFADDEVFDYKKLTYLSSRASRSKSLDREEVIFLSKDISEDMENAKEILRELNKRAWEEGLLHL